MSQFGEEDSSIDGELAGFLSKHVTGGMDASPEQVAESEAAVNPADISDILQDELSEFHDANDILIPSCVKLNKLLTNAGFKLYGILPEHIDMENR